MEFEVANFQISSIQEKDDWRIYDFKVFKAASTTMLLFFDAFRTY